MVSMGQETWASFVSTALVKRRPEVGARAREGSFGGSESMACIAPYTYAMLFRRSYHAATRWHPTHPHSNQPRADAVLILLAPAELAIIGIVSGDRHCDCEQQEFSVRVTIGIGIECDNIISLTQSATSHLYSGYHTSVLASASHTNTKRNVNWMNIKV